ncbi:hypothetical protein S820908_168 [Synechococcus phage S-CAM9]|uniref:Phage tail lysozyme domain-containing protein n=1 Tax=Synechococcus phage S-CAM9 TaxID=1883369 RepID=A0A1D8KNU5_9CAUD|nr:hypothetical protein BOW85_gp080 [Synechococcus phage S-CAM9]AOV60315.1 hypothetical protein S050808_168 [Synechococcus phage S-CAM9]AOV60543.1 hypothetical protein S820908_168 [Synechococcus phage S-CAM9]AOV60772.1 hypothetical protein N161109_169 [Synechococcus phage S-CAM9]
MFWPFTPPPQPPTPVPIPVEQFKPQWECPSCSPNEKHVLKTLQEKTNIKSVNALASILGNIKQESNFHPNICEGGARVNYNQCHSGGYGLIQWTSVNRYLGLGSFANKYGCDPSTIECQTRYMINEDQFQKQLPMFEGNFTVAQYMVPCYYWLGWGIKGNREVYAYDYSKRLVKTSLKVV